MGRLGHFGKWARSSLAPSFFRQKGQGVKDLGRPAIYLQPTSNAIGFSCP